MSTKEKCPLCTEGMDLTDKQLRPCKCGYEICLWCWHRIMEMDQDGSGGRCPGCRSIYNKDRIMGTSISNQILKELCTDKSNLQKEQTKFQNLQPVKNQQRVAEEAIDPNIVRVIQRKLVYIVGMPSEFANEKVLRQKSFLGQYGKIESIIIDNIGANQQTPDSGRVYATFSKEDEAVRCIEAVNGFILDGRPLKATFGVTRYCHVWLSNKVCRKTNCSYVHRKAPPEDICTKDEVSVFCARLQHLLGMDMKGPKQRSGNTLPSPGDCVSRTNICSGNSKDKTCINDCRVLPNVGNKNPGTLPATTSRDTSFSSGSSSSHVNATLHQQNNHDNILNNQQGLSASKSQELPPLGPKDCLNEQLVSNNDKSEASVELGNTTSISKQITSAEDGTAATSLKKPQYVNVVSQGSSGSGRRFTVLTRQSASTDTRSKATCLVSNVIVDSKKLTLAKSDCSDSITIPRCQNVKQVVKEPDESSNILANQLTSANGKSHAGTEEENVCSDISEKPAQGECMQLLDCTATHISSASQSGSPTMCNNLSTSVLKSQISVGPEKPSDSHKQSTSENQLQPLNQQKSAISCSDIASASDSRSIVNNKVMSTNGNHQTSAQGGNPSLLLSTDERHEPSAQGGKHSLYKKEKPQSGDRVSSKHSEGLFPPRPVSALPTHIEAKDRKGIKKHICPPGFKALHHYSDSDKLVSVSSPTCSALYSTSDASVQDSCSLTDQPNIIGWVSECLEDDGDTTQSNSASLSSAPSFTDNIWRRTQFPGSCLPGASNRQLVSHYPSGLEPRMGGVDNTMRCCYPLSSRSGMATHKPEYWNGSASSYMSTGGYDTFCQNTKSGMKPGMVGTLLQQPSPPQNVYNGWSTNGRVDSSLNSPQVDLAYPMYSLFG